VIIRDQPASRSSKLRRRQTRGLLEGMKAASLIQRHFVRLLFVDLEQLRSTGLHSANSLLGGMDHEGTTSSKLKR
jgi:hypothetical protein